MIQDHNSFTQSIDRLEERISQLENMYRNERTLPTQSLTIPVFPSHVDRNQESWCLGNLNQDSISSHHLELDRYQTIDKLASFHFNKMELEPECELDF